MDRELIDHVWKHCLPKEFKEEVKEIYLNAVEHHPCGYNHKTDLMKYLFGRHNLISDAVEEEMLTVPRKKVEEKWQRAYEQEAQYSRAQDSPVAREELYYNRGILSILDTLFGSECLIPPNSGELESQEADKQFNTILKDGFSNERRLNIAAQILGGIVASGKPCRQPVKRALELTDALVAECKKGGGNAAK